MWFAELQKGTTMSLARCRDWRFALIFGRESRIKSTA